MPPKKKGGKCNKAKKAAKGAAKKAEEQRSS
jgi:hypothetical protein